jgi:hypothetical protein
MTTQSANAIVDQLRQAGLNLALAPAGGLAVAPSSRLTADLRDLIRVSKAMLIDWLSAANDAAVQVLEPAPSPKDWKELAAAYHTHHFKCENCIAAGRGSRYGQRCGAGMALWTGYQDSESSTSKDQ